MNVWGGTLKETLFVGGVSNLISFMKVKCVGGHTCPPMLFMRKMNMAMTTDLTSCGTSSEITVKRTPNHVSAGKAKKIESTF